MKHLRDRQEYIDLYDRMTVDDCRRIEERNRNFNLQYASENPDIRQELVRCVGDIGLYQRILYTTLDWYNKKESTVNEWMERDKQRDHVLDTTPPPQNIRCNECLSLMTTNEKVIYDHWDDDMKVLFFFDCPRGCEKRKALFQDGTEFKPKPTVCEKCSTEMKCNIERNESCVRSTYTCPSCAHTVIDEYNLDKKEEIDPEYEADRARFVLSGESLKKAQEEQLAGERLSHFVDRMQEKEKHKKEYEAIETLKKLTVSELEKILFEATSKSGYERFQLDPPSLERIATVSFATRDTQGDRPDRESTHALMKVIKKALKDTNWRLMSDGVSYRLGVLTGRLRAYESKEDLLKLVQDDKA